MSVPLIEKGETVYAGPGKKSEDAERIAADAVEDEFDGSEEGEYVTEVGGEERGEFDDSAWRMKARSLDNRLKLQQEELQRRLDRLRSELEQRHSLLSRSMEVGEEYSERLRNSATKATPTREGAEPSSPGSPLFTPVAVRGGGDDSLSAARGESGGEGEGEGSSGGSAHTGALEARNEMLRAEVKMLRQMLDAAPGGDVSGTGGGGEGGEEVGDLAEARRKIGKYAVYIQKLQHKLAKRKVEVRELRASESRLVVKLQDLEGELDDERSRADEAEAYIAKRKKGKGKDKGKEKGESSPTSPSAVAPVGVASKLTHSPSNPLFASMSHSGSESSLLGGAGGVSRVESPPATTSAVPAKSSPLVIHSTPPQNAARPVSMSVETISHMAELERRLAELEAENAELKVKLDANATYLQSRNSRAVSKMSKSDLQKEVGALRDELEASHQLVARHMDRTKVSEAALANAEAKVKKIESSSRGKVLKEIEKSLQDARLHNKRLRDRVVSMQAIMDANNFDVGMDGNASFLQASGAGLGASGANHGGLSGSNPELEAELEKSLQREAELEKKVRAFETSATLVDAERPMMADPSGKKKNKKKKKGKDEVGVPPLDPAKQIEALKIELNSTNVQVTQLLDEINVLRAALDSEKAEVAKLKGLANSKILMDLESELKDAERHVSTLRNTVRVREEEAQVAQAEADELRVKVEELQAKIGRRARKRLRKSAHIAAATAAFAISGKGAGGAADGEGAAEGAADGAAEAGKVEDVLVVDDDDSDEYVDDGTTLRP